MKSLALGLEMGMLPEKKHLPLFIDTHSPTLTRLCNKCFPPSFPKETFIAAVAICRGLIWVVGGFVGGHRIEWADWAGWCRLVNFCFLNENETQDRYRVIFSLGL